MSQQLSRHLSKEDTELEAVKGCSVSHVIRELRTKTAVRGLPWRSGDSDSALPFRGRGVGPWAGRIPTCHRTTKPVLPQLLRPPV